MAVVYVSVLVLMFNFIVTSEQFVIPSPRNTNTSDESSSSTSDNEADDLRNKERVATEYIRQLLSGGIGRLDSNGSVELSSRRSETNYSNSLACYNLAISSFKELLIRGIKLPWMCLRNVSRESDSINEEIKTEIREEDDLKEMQTKPDKEDSANPKPTENLLQQAAKLPLFQKIFSKSKRWYLFAKKFGGKTKSCMAAEFKQMKIDFIKTLYDLAVCLSVVDPGGFAARLLRTIMPK